MEVGDTDLEDKGVRGENTKMTKQHDMQSVFKAYISDQSGASAMEYGLILAVIGVAVVSSSTLMGNGLDQRFSDIATFFNNTGLNTP